MSMKTVLMAVSCLVASGSTMADYRSMTVTVTAYNSVTSQTDGTPFLAAWNNRLRPGMKAIAVSRDLLDEGLTDGTVVAIEGFDEDYQVVDKMDDRFTRRIDIYMGTDVERARQWGEQQRRIWWYEDTD